MTDFRSEPWRSFLPDVYHWADKLSYKEVSNAVVGAHHIVPVAGQNDQQDKFEVLTTELPEQTKQSINQAALTLGWRPKIGPTTVVIDQSSYVLVPTTKVKTTKAQVDRQIGLDAGRVLKGTKVAHLVFCGARDIDSIQVLDGLALSLYAQTMFKATVRKNPQQKDPLPELVSFWDSAVTEQRFEQTKALIKSCAFTRMLQDAPANWLDPERFAEIAKDVAADVGAQFKVLNRKEMIDLGMGSFLSVAQGSPKEPQLITVEIPGKDQNKNVALVGKGLTFDTGGNSIKPSQGMGEMKYDMSGGAAVLGSAMYLGALKPPTTVICVIGAVENMPGATATRPGDIVVAMNGKSIDIQNTDAEGRLVLADCLAYVNETYKPELIIDAATLTGACLHALGTVGAAVMSNEDGFAHQILEASRAVGEPFWQLPLWPELEKEVKGEASDLCNIAKPNVRAGTIIGGVFLAEFVGKTRWAHLDIAGTGWSCKATGFPTNGGSAYAVRTMSEVCLRQG